MKNLVDAEKTSVNGVSATVTTSPTRLVTPEGQAGVQSNVGEAGIISAGPASERVDPYAREGAFFGSNVVNLPNGKPEKAGGVDFFIGHRFSQDVHAAGLGGLFGFDSSATVAYGVRTGITDRFSLSLLRSNLFKTISFGSAFQVSRQGETVPVTLDRKSVV